MNAADFETAEDVRRCVLAEHAELRPLLDEVAGLAERFEHGDETTGRALREAGFQLYQRLSAHLDLEQALLVDRLHASEAGHLADRLEREHKEQRQLLDYILNRLGESTLPTHLIARELLGFTNYIRQDMAQEEESLLSPDVLHD